MGMNYCDLHVHSTYSDGSCSPKELVEIAEACGLCALALTDHNTVEGLSDFFEAASGKIAACGGCEITTEDDGLELHLLGLFLDPKRIAPLQVALSEQLARKEHSNRDTIERLSGAGYDVSYAEFVELYGTGVKNRVHIANYLISKGIISEVSEAFDGLLSEHMGFYREPKKLDFYEMIGLIHEVGGVAVWAHPLFLFDRDTCEKIICKAKAVGLDGVEVYYSTYSEDDTAFMHKLCEKYYLLESGGSDFHGANKKRILMGTGYGNLRIPLECYEKLKERKEAYC